MLVGFVLVATACAGGKAAAPQRTSPPATSLVPQAGGTLRYAVPRLPRTWNPDLAGVDAPGRELLEQVYPSVFVTQPNLTAVLDTAIVTDARQLPGDPQIVVYTVNPLARWSDGVPVTAADFRYAWLTQNGRSCVRCRPVSTVGYDRIRSVTGADHGRTVTVRFRRRYVDWRALFGGGRGLLPAHVAQRHGSLAHSFNHYFAATPPTVSAGPFVPAAVTSRQVTLHRNPGWAGGAPSLDTLVFRAVPGLSAELAALRDHRVDVAEPRPAAGVPAATRAAREPGISLTQRPSLAWQQLVMNLRDRALRDRALRLALFTVLDRAALIARAVPSSPSPIAPLNNRFFVPGQAGYRDDVTSVGLGSGDLDKAERTLKGAGYKGVGHDLFTPGGHRVPPIVLRYSRGLPVERAECQLIVAAARELGLRITVLATTSTATAAPWGMLLTDGQGSTFPTSGAGAAYRHSDPADIGGYGNPQVDQLLRAALAAASATVAARDDDAADLIVSQDAYSLPLFQLPGVLGTTGTTIGARLNVSEQGSAYDADHWSRGKLER